MQTENYNNGKIESTKKEQNRNSIRKGSWISNIHWRDTTVDLGIRNNYWPWKQAFWKYWIREGKKNKNRETKKIYGGHQVE